MLRSSRVWVLCSWGQSLHWNYMINLENWDYMRITMVYWYYTYTLWTDTVTSRFENAIEYIILSGPCLSLKIDLVNAIEYVISGPCKLLKIWKGLSGVGSENQIMTCLPGLIPIIVLYLHRQITCTISSNSSNFKLNELLAVLKIKCKSRSNFSMVLVYCAIEFKLLQSTKLKMFKVCGPKR